VYVKLGDPVTRGQRIARIEDREIREQVKQAEAAFEVARATIRQREADLKFAETNLERSRELFGRQLLPKQTLDDADARYQAAVAQVELSRAQLTQSQARLEELRINLANTVIVSPVTGFVAKRNTDAGAYASQNAPVVDVVDISLVRLIANVVEKDMRRVNTGDAARVEVDAFPGETFTGRIARVAPVLDPATRTAQIEVEIPNASKRLKPGMYARVNLTIEERANALVVPANAVIDREGQRGVFLASNNTAAFRPVQIGIEDAARVEILSGVTEKDQVITTGAAALQDGDRILLAGQGDGPSTPRAPAGPRGGRQGQGMRGQNNQRPGGGQGR
jgi:RND family efflux transporter MFP subunit